MAYIKFKELAKYFDFKTEVKIEDLEDYAKDYIDNKEARQRGRRREQTAV